MAILKKIALLTLMAVLLIARKDSPGPTVTFFVEHEVEPQKDYIEIVINIKAEDTSLKEALADAEDTVKCVRDLIEEHCKTYSKKKGECQEITESGKFNVEPLYRIIRTEPVFVGMSADIQPSQSPMKSLERSSILMRSDPLLTRLTARMAPISTVSSGSPSKYLFLDAGKR